MQAQKLRQIRTPALVAAALFVVALTAVAPVYSQVNGINVTVSQQKADVDNEGVKQDLIVNANVHLQCGGQGTSSTALTVTSHLYGPSGALVGSASTSDPAPACGVNGYTFVMEDVLLSSGMYTIVTTATLGPLSSTNSHNFDPHVDGSMGPL